MWARTFLLGLWMPGLVGSAVGPSVVEFAETCVCQLTPRVARPSLGSPLDSDGSAD